MKGSRTRLATSTSASLAIEHLARLRDVKWSLNPRSLSWADGQAALARVGIWCLVEARAPEPGTQNSYPGLGGRKTKKPPGLS